jgi:NADH dehydrogenase (ubiquinone) Fe-S protein 5
MASGYGLHGGRGRCYPMWQDFAKCYAQADRPEDCTLQAEDYYECLTRSKEIARARTIQQEYYRQQAAKKAEEDARAKHSKQDPSSFMSRLTSLTDGLKSDKSQ